MAHPLDFAPPPDRLRETIDCANRLIEAISSWSPCHCGLGDRCRCRTDAKLPGFPEAIGRSVLIEKLHGLERRLNPCCLPLDHIQRNLIEVIGWPGEVKLGLAWLGELVARLLESWDLRWLAIVQNLADGPPEGVSWRVEACPPLVLFEDGFDGLRRAARLLEDQLSEYGREVPRRDAVNQALLPDTGRVPWQSDGFLAEGTVQGAGVVDDPALPMERESTPSATGVPSLTPAEARKRLEAIASTSRSFVEAIRQGHLPEGLIDRGAASGPARHRLTPGSIRLIRTVRRLAFLKGFGCGISPILDAAASDLDAASFAEYAHLCEFWSEWGDEVRAGLAGEAAPVSKFPEIWIGDEDLAALSRILDRVEVPSPRIDGTVSTASGSAPGSGRSERPLKAPSERRFKRGELDEQAAITLAVHPGWTNEQIAASIGCHPKSLSSRNLSKFRQCRAMLEAGKEDFRADDERRDRRRRDSA